ncbi:HNH endonuclease [Mycobacterium colombiense]|uniref:HNH endonuclease n=1 Tax=Mycobacterium colombiense TaxID=339268 RepID=A0A329MD83_9MYCO|nr:HNH endonuclease [Mycobacterium colombiense]
MSTEKECRRTIAERAQGFCERCGRCGPLTLHHRKKKGQGGAWDPTNCVLVDGHGTTGCHGWIESHPNAAEAEGFHVRPWRDPAEIPILYRGEWGYLTADGKVRIEREEVAPESGDLPPR